MNIQIFPLIAGQQLSANAIGTKVVLAERDLIDSIVKPAVEAFEEVCSLADALVDDIKAQYESGQYSLPVPVAQLKFFSCGVGLHTHRPEDYVVRKWRDNVQLFLRRGKAAEVRSCNLVVYTREAYLADPQLTEEQREWLLPDTSHVLITCLAVGGPERAQHTVNRLARNIAGGNAEWSPEAIAQRIMTEHYDAKQAEGMDPEILFGAALHLVAGYYTDKLAAAVEYDDRWCVVAD